MPKTKRTPRIETRIAPDDLILFDFICRIENKTRSELARESILWYMDNKNALMYEKRDSLIEARLKKMENRLASLYSKQAIDIGTIHGLLWISTDPKEREKLFTEAYIHGVKRLRRRLGPEEEDLKPDLGLSA